MTNNREKFNAITILSPLLRQVRAIMIEQNLIDVICSEVLKQLNELNLEKEDGIKVGVSARHVHVTQEDLDLLYGKGYQLTKLRTLMGEEFASNELVTLVGPSLRSIEKVRILGPVRKATQVELAKTDAVRLGITPPVRPSGEIKGSSPVVIVGPKGVVHIKEGCIIANRHIHMTTAAAAEYGLKDNDSVDVELAGTRPTRFYDVQIRVSDRFNTEMHIDTDDGNAAGIKSGDRVRILKDR